MIIIVRKNDILIVTIEDVTSMGDGIAKHEGYPLFVNGGVTGDEIEITVTKTNKTYGFGRINKILTPSPYRKAPDCPAFDSCGGCDFMHISYDYQLKIKSDTIVGNLRKIGGVAPDEYEFEGVIGAVSKQNYRNKAQLPIGKKGKKTVFGFYSKKSHDIVPISSCLIQNDDINKAAKVFLDFANEYKISVYDEKSHTGILRHIYVRTGNTTGDMLFVVVTNSKKILPHSEVLVQRLIELCPGIKGIIQNINTEKTNLVLGKGNKILWGEDKITSYIDNLRFDISSESFFQVNGEQTQKLYAKALEYASPEKDETVFDLYCGTGSISLFLATKANRVIGVEIVEKAIENAKENAALNGITNADFFAGDCAKTVDVLVANGEKADIVVVDPPRKGCSEDMLTLIDKMAPKKLVYVSCNSATLARDVKILSEYGFSLKKVCGVDMFPNSTHVECVVLISKK